MMALALMARFPYDARIVLPKPEIIAPSRTRLCLASGSGCRGLERGIGNARFGFAESQKTSAMERAQTNERYGVASAPHGTLRVP